MRRKTDEEKRLAGTYRPDRAEKPAPKPTTSGGVGRMPAGLSQFKIAAKMWRIWSAELGDQLRPVDGPALQLLCLHTGLALEAMAHLAEHGPTVKDFNHGGVKRNPAGTILLQNSAAAVALMKEFGLTPKSRLPVREDEGATLEDMLSAIVGRMGD